jgi:hypothetical protein
LSPLGQFEWSKVPHYWIFRYSIIQFNWTACNWFGATDVWVNPKEYRHVGNALAAARTELGITQQQLAKSLRKPQSFVSSYERGQRRIDVLELLRIVEALKGDPLVVFKDILERRGEGKSRRG